MRLFVAIIVFPVFLFADQRMNLSEQDLISSFLSSVSKGSLESRAIDSQEKSALLESDSNLVQFDYNGFIQADIVDSKNPQTSPFSSDSTKEYTYSTGISKLWSNGLETSLNYSLSDSFISFPSRDSSDFFLPDLGITLKTNLFKDLLSRRLSFINPRVEQQKKSIQIKSKIEKKAILVNALLALSQILEIKDEIQLQKKLCQQISKQTNHLQRKRRRGAVPRREHLLSKKELNTCLANNKTLQKNLFEKKEDLRIKYNLDIALYTGMKVSKLFEAIESLFSRKDFQVEQFKLSDNDEIRSLQYELESLRLQNREAKSLTQPDLSLELTGGLQGLNKNISPAHEDISKTNFPYVSASIKLGFPFEDRGAKITHLSIKYQQQALEDNLKLLKAEKNSRLTTLSHSLEKDFSIYKDYQTNVNLSEDILLEAQRDFNNGRINFSILSEFQKGLIESRRNLSKLRTEIVLNTVEYIDYFKFFDEFL